MGKVIIIIPSETEKPGKRFISGYEWTNAWGFAKDSKVIALRMPSLQQINFVEVKDLVGMLKDIPEIVWLKKAGKCVIEEICEKLIGNQIMIAYHDTGTLNVIPKECMSKDYSLAEGNRSRFENILLVTENNTKFNTAAPLSDYIEAFFLNNDEAFSVLKHKIAHLFLSIDMDLQGIAEVKMREKKNESILNGKGSKDYLKEVLDDKKDETYYTKLLGDLQFMIAGCKLDKKVTKNIKDDYLPEKKSVLDLIDDKKDTIKEKKGELMKLCGLVEKDGGISSNKDSIICKFMEMMGKEASKNENEIDNKDVNDILEFFKKAEIKQGINSFHDWFCALDNCLEKIREAIK